ncbi:MAG TPA: TIM barrel protein [Verrucomicrobiae bacterium]|nr:TIM barrel protein [Verrucomicrobiae bacterium]
MKRIINRRAFLKLSAGAILLPSLALAMEGLDWRKTLFLMDTWFWQAPPDLDVPAQVRLVKKIGYGGMALSWGQKHFERLDALRENGLKTPGCFITADIDGAYPKHLSACVQLLKGTPGQVWLALTSKAHTKSAQTGDAAALEIIKACAEECKSGGVAGLALYPHVGFWMEQMDHAIRLARTAARPEVGVQFNQYHWMVADRGQNLRETLQSALPFLKSASINGSNENPPSILPLSEGSYDVAPILKTLADFKFRGPISHQGYSIKGNLPERLAAAKESWDNLRKRVSG